MGVNALETPIWKSKKSPGRIGAHSIQCLLLCSQTRPYKCQAMDLCRVHPLDQRSAPGRRKALGQQQKKGLKMPDDTFRQQLRKKILDLKTDAQDCYTETYNLVQVMIRLNPNAFTTETAKLLDDKLIKIYTKPSPKYNLSLSQLEQSYFRHRTDPSVRFRSKIRIDITDMKQILDKVRRDLLFYLALVEDRPSNFDIVLKNAVSKSNGGDKENP